MRWLAVAFVVGLLVAAACSTASVDEIDEATTSSMSLAPIDTTTSAAPPATVASVPRGGSVSIASFAPPTLHPYDPEAEQVPRITQAIYSGATTIEAGTQRVIPDLLAEVPSLANGGVVEHGDGSMTVEYRIHEDAVWQDGEPVTGHDFLLTLDAVLSTGRGDPAYDLIDRSTVVAEEKLLRVTFPEATLGYDQLFDVVAPKHQVEGTDFVADWRQKPWLTAGPFIVAEYEPTNHIRLVRNENYWRQDEAGEQLPYLDEVTIILAPSAEHVELFNNQEIDSFIAFNTATVRDLPPLQDIPGVEVQTYRQFTGRFEHLALQVGSTGAEVNPETAMPDLRLRRAIAHAVDRPALASELLGELGLSLDSYVDVFSPSISTKAWDQYTHDPETAAALVADVCADLGRDCAADPIPVVLATMSTDEVRMGAVESIAAVLESAGLDAVIRPWDTSEEGNSDEVNACWDDGLCEGSVWAWINGPDVASLVSFHEIFDPREPWAASYGWGTSEPSAGSAAVTRYIQLLDEMRSTVDPAALRLLIAEAEQILADEVVFIPLFATVQGAALWEGTIGNYQPDSAYSDTWNMGEWYRADLTG